MIKAQVKMLKWRRIVLKLLKRSPAEIPTPDDWDVLLLGANGETTPLQQRDVANKRSRCARANPRRGATAKWGSEAGWAHTPYGLDHGMASTINLQDGLGHNLGPDIVLNPGNKALAGQGASSDREGDSRVLARPHLLAGHKG